MNSQYYDEHQKNRHHIGADLLDTIFQAFGADQESCNDGYRKADVSDNKKKEGLHYVKTG